MPANPKESHWHRFRDFLIQKPEDHEYENNGGDDRLPEDQWTDDPLADANEHARALGEEVPWPSHVRTSSNPWDGPENIHDAYNASTEEAVSDIVAEADAEDN